MHPNRKYIIFLTLLVGLLFGALVFLIPSVPTSAQGQDTAHIIVQFGHDGSLVRDIQFTAPISGLAALQQTSLDVVTKDYGGGFIAVCAIEGVGCPAEECFSCDPDGKYWGQFIVGRTCLAAVYGWCCRYTTE